MSIPQYWIGRESQATGRFHRNEKAKYLKSKIFNNYDSLYITKSTKLSMIRNYERKERQ